MVTRQERIDAFTHQGVPPQTSRLKFFARITSAPMSFHFCADGVAVLGRVWIPVAQSKLQSSAGACVDGNRTALIVEIHRKQDREPTSIESVPADGHHGCQLQEHGDFGTPPSFILRAVYKKMGMPEIKNNRSRPLLCYRPRLIHLFRV
jgi:hypothetical protein